DAVRAVEQRQTGNMRLRGPGMTPPPMNMIEPTLVLPAEAVSRAPTPPPPSTLSATPLPAPLPEAPPPPPRKGPPVWIFAAGAAVLGVGALAALLLTRGGGDEKKQVDAPTVIGTLGSGTSGSTETSGQAGEPPTLSVA